MSIMEAIRIYRSAVEDVSNDYFGDEWKAVAKELTAVVESETEEAAAAAIECWGCWKQDYTAIEVARKIRLAYMGLRNERCSENLLEFIAESNRIEGIERSPLATEIMEMLRFLALSRVTVEDLEKFVSVYQPNAKLRDKPGMNVRVGNYFPPPGGSHIRLDLFDLLDNETSPYERHLRYESLHPFTDCNGRSGRALWLWDMKGAAPLGFLHTWYYHSLSQNRK